MRPLYLTIAGLNSFIETQFIDFTKLTMYGLFGITGPTGSGKSTILDAVTLALYGEMERGRDDFINSQSNEAHVSFEFEIRGNITKHYRVERKYKRQKNGGQTNIYAVLSQKSNDVFMPLTEKSKETNQAVYEILGLRYDDFKRAVMLPQGKFSEFLMLKESERNAMLERILSYESIGNALREKIKIRHEDESFELLSLQKKIEFYKDATDDHLLDLQKEKDATAIKIAEVKNEISEFSVYLEKIKETYRLQQELQQFLDKKVKVENLALEIDKQKTLLSLFNKAKELRPFIQKAEKDGKEYNDTLIKQAQIQKDFIQETEKMSKAKEEYEKLLKYKEEHYANLIKKQANLNQALLIADALVKMQNDINSLRDEFKANKTAVKKIDTKKAKMLFEKEAAEKELAEVLEEKQRLRILPDYRIKVEKGIKSEDNFINIQKQLSENRSKYSAMQAEYSRVSKLFEQKNSEYADCTEIVCTLTAERLFILKEKGAEAEEKEAHLKDEIASNELLLTEVKANIQNITQAKEAFNLSNIASILAENLKDGEPCAVCGSTSHPTPAKKLSDHVLDQLDSALVEERKKEDKLNIKIRTDQIEYAKTENEIKTLSSEIALQEEAVQRELNEKPLDWLKNAMYNFLQRFELLNKDINKYEKKWPNTEIQRQEKLNTLTSISGQRLVLEEKLKNLADQIKLSETDLETLSTAFESAFDEYQKVLLDLNTDKISVLKEEIDNADKLLPIISEKENNLRSKLQFLAKETESLAESESNIKLRQHQLEVVGKEKADQFELQNKQMILLSEGRDAAAYLNDIKNEIEILVTNEKNQKLQLEQSQQRAAEAQSEQSKITAILILKKDESEKAEKDLSEQLVFHGLDLSSVLKYNITDSEVSAIEKRIESFKDETASIAQNITRIQESLDGRETSKDELEKAQRYLEEKNDEFTLLSQRVAVADTAIKKLAEDLLIVKELHKEEKEISYKLSLTATLKQMLMGNKFIEFISKSDLQYITRESSRGLQAMTNGRYALEYDGKEFIMRDDNWGGYRRAASSLSGGEIFLTSLSLALALSTKIQLKSAPLEFFFLDEGFGTLDSSLIDIVMSSLENLHNARMAIGLITHVEELKSRLPVKLNVQPSQKGGNGTRVSIDY